MKSSAKVLKSALGNFRGELTVADAAARSGLPLREAEVGLRALAAESVSHLAATSTGELIYMFPRGLGRPADTRLLRRVGRAVGKVAMGVVRFVVRAWVSVVLVGYALVFLAVVIALALRGGDDSDTPIEGVGIVFRMIAEALFWTFHPFSPVYIGGEPGWMHAAAPSNRRLPFYERVNRFVFGPPKLAPDPLEQERAILIEIRRLRGRIAPGDVMRVTGLSREAAERLLLRLVVDYNGDIAVTDTGAILYSFAELRTTALRSARVEAAPPIWNRHVALPPLTGNRAGSNVLFAFINGFNLLASGFVLANGFTLERLAEIFQRLRNIDPAVGLTPLPAADGIPLVLGAIPFAFSLALFALPLLRVLRRPAAVRRIARENGWRALLRLVLDSARADRSVEYTGDELAKAWVAAGGRSATEAELQGAVRDLGGEAQLREDGILIYRFEIVTRELEALLAERARATDRETSAGDVVFSSGDEGPGIREDERRPVFDDVASPVTNPTKDTTNDVAKDARSSLPLLEETKEPLEFLERLMVEAKRRRD